MKSEVKCKITDLLKDYVVLHERIKALYTMLEVHGYIHWYWLESNHAKKKNYWENYYDIVKNTIAIDIKTFDPIKCKEDMENISVRNNHIHEIKKEIKRYHRLQSNIQNVLDDMCVGGDIKSIYKQYNTEEVPSLFKNGMNYTYYTRWNDEFTNEEMTEEERKIAEEKTREMYANFTDDDWRALGDNY